jgi:hypothetical protein
MQLPDRDERLARYASDSFDTDGLLTNIHILRIHQARLGPGAQSTNPNVSGYTIQIATHGVIHDTALGLDIGLQSLTRESDCRTTSFWVAGSILRSALPNLVKYFKGKNVVLPVENLSYPPVRCTILSQIYLTRTNHFFRFLSRHHLTVNCLLSLSG